MCLDAVKKQSCSSILNSVKLIHRTLTVYPREEWNGQLHHTAQLGEKNNANYSQDRQIRNRHITESKSGKRPWKAKSWQRTLASFT